MTVRFILSWLLPLCLLIKPAAAQDTTGAAAIVGRVTDDAGAAAPGIRVCLLDAERCVVSGADGAFRIDSLRPGEYRLLIESPPRPPIVSEPITARAGLEASVQVALPAFAAIEQSVTVTAPAFAVPDEVKTSAILVTPEEVFKSAGALQDVSRYVQTLPGVAIGSDDFRNDIIVRGGSPLENLFIVDNVEIPNINAFANVASAGGTVGILDAALLQDITFLTGGYPAPYINRTSSVLQITQREGGRDRVGGRATLGFAGAGIIAEGPIRKGRGSWVVSARRSFLDLFTDDVGIGGVPVTTTFNGKAVYDLGPRDRLWAVNLTGNDSIRLGAAESLDDPESELNNLDINYSGWRSATGLNWQRTYGARGVGLLGLTYSTASTSSAIKDLLEDGIPPPEAPIDEVIANAPIAFEDTTREQETTIKYDLTLLLPAASKLQVGGSVKQFRLAYDISQPSGFDSPYSATPDLNPIALDTQFTAWQTGAYAQASSQVTSRLNVTAGARVDWYEAIAETRVSPRIGASYRITDRLSWRTSYGTYYQQPFFIFLTAFPENRTLVPFRADHVVTGISLALSDRSRLTAEYFDKRYKDYPVATQFPSVSLANVGDTFDIRQILFPLTSAGRGHARGVELFFERKSEGRWFGQANFAVSDTKHGGLDGIRRPGSFDYPVIANAIGGYRISPKWELSARVSYLSGRPYTPFDEAASTEQSRGIFDLTRVNAERASDYFRLDVRVDRTFTAWGRPVLVFAGVQNVTNRRNFAGYSWNRRTNTVRFDEQLGLFPVLGIDWRF
jgi:hypothetical protein